MKKLATLITVAAMAFGCAMQANAEERIAPEQVPNSLRVFVQDNFGKDVTIVKAERDPEFGGYEYEVTLSNGVEIDYGASEEWLEVDGEKAGVDIPASIVGEEIMNHISVTYPGKTVRSIERKDRKYKVELNDGTDLVYDKNGKFVKAER